MLARSRQTLVVYMGLSTAGAIARELTAHGMDPATPAAGIENGTLPAQRVVTATVATLERIVESNAIASPALIVIGAVAGLAGATKRAPALAAQDQSSFRWNHLNEDKLIDSKKLEQLICVRLDAGCSSRVN